MIEWIALSLSIAGVVLGGISLFMVMKIAKGLKAMAAAAKSKQ
jgi:hypothetical protein